MLTSIIVALNELNIYILIKKNQLHNLKFNFKNV